MAQPELKDGDDDPPEFDVDFIPDESPPQFYWTKDQDEIRRAFIFDKMADPNIAGHILVENLECVFRWLKTGDVPKTSKKSHLKPVRPGEDL